MIPSSGGWGGSAARQGRPVPGPHPYHEGRGGPVQSSRDALDPTGAAHAALVLQGNGVDVLGTDITPCCGRAAGSA